MNEETDDSKLLGRIAEGDESAMTDLYLAYESAIYAFALKKLNDTQAAADIVHEVMIAVWKGAAGFQGKSRVKSWLFGIAHNKIVDHLRKSIRHEADELEDDLLEDEAETSEQLVEAAQNSRFLAHCLEKLSDLHQQVVHLAFFEDMSYGEIAGIIGKPEGTVKTRMYHARQLLKKCLELRIGE